MKIRLFGLFWPKIELFRQRTNFGGLIKRTYLAALQIYMFGPRECFSGTVTNGARFLCVGFFLVCFI